MLDYYTFDFKKPTVQLLGKWQPWHEGHTELFKKALTITGQVVIMAREVYGSEEDAPFGEISVVDTIKQALAKEGYYDGINYIIMCVPNIVDVSHGGHGSFSITEHNLESNAGDIRSSDIREQLRQEGKL
jgi:hypothetical protein